MSTELGREAKIDVYWYECFVASTSTFVVYRFDAVKCITFEIEIQNL